MYRRDLDVSGGGGGRAAARRSRVAARVRGAQEARRPLDVEEAALETPQLEVSQAQRKLAPCLRDPGFISPNVFAPEKGKGRWRRKRLPRGGMRTRREQALAGNCLVGKLEH